MHLTPSQRCTGQTSGNCGDLVEEGCLFFDAPVWIGAVIDKYFMYFWKTTKYFCFQADSANECLTDLTLFGALYHAHHFLYDNNLKSCSLFASGARSCTTLSGPR